MVVSQRTRQLFIAQAILEFLLPPFKFWKAPSETCLESSSHTLPFTLYPSFLCERASRPRIVIPKRNGKGSRMRDYNLLLL